MYQEGAPITERAFALRGYREASWYWVLKAGAELSRSEVLMSPQFYGYLGVLFLLLTGVRIVWRKGPKPNDWELLVAFIRLDFPPQQRDIAQKIATGLAEIVGLKIKQLRPEHTLEQIAGWADDSIHAKDLITLFVIAFGVHCDANTKFRDLVEKITEKGRKSAKPDSETGKA